jgi:hypothetical protein
LSGLKKIEIEKKVYEELYKQTRDEKRLKEPFMGIIQTFAAYCLKTEEERIKFFKEFILNYPELLKDIERMFTRNQCRKISDTNNLADRRGIEHLFEKEVK